MARILAGILFAASILAAQTAISTGKRHPRLAVRGAWVLEGVGTPFTGPKDILIENNRIAAIVPSAAARAFPGAAEIDARGKYVLPGFINSHAHIQDERGGAPMAFDYCLKLWLACGVTTVRDVGSDFEKSKKLREESAAGTRAAPRIFLYRAFRAATPDEARATVRRYKEEGADGIKLFGIYRDVMAAMSEEADKLGLRRAHHAGVEETNALDDARFRSASIEHWYGIPDAALAGGVQNFPPAYNYDNELDRFRHAGRLWREAEPARLAKVLQALADARVAWDPTLSIYEAARDLDRAQNQPQFGRLLHPALEGFFKPDLRRHGSFFVEWTTDDEVYWKENYRIWMKAVRDFAELGGMVAAGEDAGFIYKMYGYGYLRELELHREAGFHPLKIVQHATHNGAVLLGREAEIGRLRAGWLADLIVVNKNPLENLKALYPPGIEWTVKDGIPYHAPALLNEIQAMVEKARAGRP
jgi:imidazolonepropionase-like amidohydrolase